MRRNYTKEFKIDAVNLYKRSGRSADTIADELRIAKSTFSKWIRVFNQEGVNSFPGKGHAKERDEELHALRKELQHVRLERDI